MGNRLTQQPAAFAPAIAGASRDDAGAEDARLVEALRSGVPDAAGRLWDRYAPLVRRVVRRALGPAGEVDDLVQEVFLRVFQRVHDLREPHALRNFVLIVTSSVIASELRKRKVRWWLRLTPAGRLPEHAAAPRDDDGREALGRIYAALSRASHEERMALVLRNLEGLELPEVAEALGISVATVKRRLARVQERVVRAVASDPELARALGLGGQPADGHERGGRP